MRIDFHRAADLASTPRIQHPAESDPCKKCGGRAFRHVAKRERSDRSRYKAYHASISAPRSRPKRSERIIGIDGEGLGRRPHRYAFLAGSDEFGTTWEVEGHRLSAEQCLQWIVDLPDRALVVAFAFFYDLTKILQDLPNDKLFYLLHEEKRAIVRDGRIIYRAVRWGKFRLHFMNRRFTVQCGKKRVTVWDIFAFFQGKFTQALRDWKVCAESEIAKIEAMKDQRSAFATLTDEIKVYCRSECLNLAKLARALLDAHEDCGLKLKTYYGAGSTAKSLLNKFNAKEYMHDPPKEMRDAIARSFFGGRFENSVTGPISGPVYNADISSAYPYQITFLPCLVHGRWEHAQRPSIRDLETARLALVHWTIPNASQGILGIPRAFGPFPVRAKTGTIAFPLAGKGGWVWRDEFLAGKRMEPNAEPVEAWLYHTDCDCAPFADIPNYYLERLKWGKESKGIVLKLGPNAVYGSLAQSRGLNPPFQSWIWAANITSGCRAQLDDAICTIPDSRDVLMLATDGIFGRKPFKLATPRDTGTFHVPKPLGGWEYKEFPQGIFAARPGIYWPQNPTKEDLKQVRARGIGKVSLLQKWRRVSNAWHRGEKSVELRGLARFVGAKSGIHAGGGEYRRSPDYGEWIDHHINVSFDPHPKRMAVGPNQTLLPWEYFDWESEPYEPATKSPEAIALMMAELIANEQPDTDFDYGEA